MRSDSFKYLVGLGGLCLILLSCKSNKTIIEQVPPRTISEVLDTLSSKYMSYDFLYAKAKLKYNGEESRIGGRMTVMMVPDSVIWMNFKKISIEGADMSFNQLQELMVGNVPIPEPEEIDLYQESSEYLLEFSDVQGRYRYKLDMDMNLSHIEINDMQGRTFAMSISEYDDGGFGRKRDIQITDVDSTSSHIAMKFSTVTFDEPRSIKFDIPEHYRKLP